MCGCLWVRCEGEREWAFAEALACVRHHIRSLAHIISFNSHINLFNGTVVNPFYTGNEAQRIKVIRPRSLS